MYVKMGKCKFNDKWMEKDVFRMWLAPAKNKNEAMCKFCKKTFSLGTMGVKAVESHMKGGKHLQYMAAANSKPGLIPALFAAPPNVASSDATSQSTIKSFVSPPETQKAEVMWVLHTVMRHNSFKSNEEISEVFAAMFPDSQLAKSFSCGENKTAYIAKYGIASFIKKELSRSVSEKPYVIMFDESMNKTTKNKQMDLHLRFWTTDDETGTHHVISRYYRSEFMGHSRAEDMLGHFSEGTKELNLNNMLSLSMDGPSVNWRFVELLQEEHREQCGGAQLQIIGSCGLHTMHNSFKNGFTVWQVEKVLKALHYLFHYAPARREDFVLLTKCDRFPLPFCGHRWLENLPAVERAIEIWPYIVSYVDQVKAKKLPNPRSSSYDTIAEARMDPIILAKLHFFMSISRTFQPFLTKYQTDAPMIPFLGRDLEDLIRSLLRRFIKRDVQVDVSPVNLVKLDVTDQKFWVSPKQVDIGLGATAALKVVL
ncbi:uncharacterized protein LOC134326630 isoform X2 [Trichomycterus rosablanca]|uniref:uncharacterized protein LOC134326630 isoform X2 n=1 Tax=Trichomycterus rosablanca TaxID=2290929 RepID=UPI002F356679